ncbi:isochorismatase domain-containing protein 2-like [Stylophora pistillata]|uniref:Isochorismatase domain-containing protein 2, mitochondrial n=1 Tax=Stylophora pistillata TaxID=50429 RepID=A0A2B4SGT4_STYPI|nr:isochorismatase domain-containing protein 2-like [Stylophora pistillata]PFX29904.1 Isochorismatase domain-containing protein 2, mitochondrial [Stylophora pistillata]
MAAKLGRLAVNNTAFFLCDIQEKFRPSIRYFPEIIKVAQRMTAAAKIMNIPVIATEQYPKGLGNTVKEIDTDFFKEQIFPKTKFSMVIPEVEEQLKQRNIKNVVLMGIETQVCVLQTTMDLLEKNYTVHVLADGVSSRTMVERMFALERLREMGAIVTTSECALFMLLGDAKHPNFREVQALVKTAAPDSGLLSKC